jgi:hypothetical protein
MSSSSGRGKRSIAAIPVSCDNSVQTNVKLCTFNTMIKAYYKSMVVHSRSPETCNEENMCTVPPYSLTDSTKFTYFCRVATSAFLQVKQMFSTLVSTTWPPLRNTIQIKQVYFELANLIKQQHRQPSCSDKLLFQIVLELHRNGMHSIARI